MEALPPILGDEFRLLKITGIDPVVKCDVEVFKFETTEIQPESGVKYAALSYAWGNEAHTVVLMINGHIFSVTRNLYSAICELYSRIHAGQAWYWIDQICIDQTNKDEKSLQVRAMDRIYAGAECTLIWLGPGDDDTKKAMRSIPLLKERMGQPPWPKDSEGRSTIRRRLVPEDHEVWRNLIKLYNLPWYRRLWVIQEVVLSKEAYVLLGDLTLLWKTVVEFAEAIVFICPEVIQCAVQGSAENFLPGFSSCLSIGHVQSHASCRSLFDLLRLSREREVSTPIDRVYGIAAMLPQKQRLMIEIDYSLEYVDAILKFCSEVCSEDYPFLELLSMAPSVTHDKDLPSWCPDFRIKALEISPFTSNGGLRAGFTNDEPRRNKIRLLNHPRNAISVPGFRVDIVASAVEIKMRAAPTPDAIAAAMMKCENECRELFEQAKQGQTSTASLQEAYSRTLIVNHWEPLRPVPIDYKLQNDLVTLRREWSAVANGGFVSTSSAVQAFMVAMGMNDRRRFFSTENGRIGMGPSQVQQGDIVCVFDSGAPLWVLRYDKDHRDGGATLIGEAYIHEFMDLQVTARDRADVIDAREQFIIV